MLTNNQNEKSVLLQKWISHFTFFQKLIALAFVEEILLFGSRARQDNNDRADIDLAVICPKADHYDWLTIQNIIDEADTLLKIDCTRFDTLDNENDFKKNILKDCVVLYKKEKQWTK